MNRDTEEETNGYVVFTSLINYVSKIMLRNCVVVKGEVLLRRPPPNFVLCIALIVFLGKSADTRHFIINIKDDLSERRWSPLTESYTSMRYFRFSKPTEIGPLYINLEDKFSIVSSFHFNLTKIFDFFIINHRLRNEHTIFCRGLLASCEYVLISINEVCVSKGVRFYWSFLTPCVC